MGNNGSSPKYDDDEPIVGTGTPVDNSGKETVGVSFDLGKVQLDFDNEPRIPPEATNYKLLIELMGRGTSIDRPGVDIVMVLNVSQSMTGEKLKEMKRAMQFVIKKLSPSDRLSIVTFSSDPDRKCRLRQMTPKDQEETDILVQKLLTAKGSPNVTSGLQMGLKVLDDRKYTTGRSGAVILVSDSIQNVAKDGRGFPVFTFGVGADGVYDAGQVQNSKGGNLSIVFSRCLGELLSVLVQDLQLVLKPLTDNVSEKERVTSKINKVYAGNYPQTVDDKTGNVTVSFGDIYQKEMRTVVVDLFLPKVPDEEEIDLDALNIGCTYRSSVSGNLTSTNPYVFRVTRSTTRATNPSDATKAEITRMEVVELINEARNLADKNLEEALNKALKAQDLLRNLYLQKPNPVIEALKLEVDELVKYLQTEGTNNYQPYTNGSKTSYQSQGLASRGDVQKTRCYALPRMDNSLRAQLLMPRSKSSQVIPLVPSYHLSATTLKSRLTLSQASRTLSIRKPESIKCGGPLPRDSFITKATVNVLPLPA